MERRAILNASLVNAILHIVDHASAPTGTTTSAWERRVDCAIAPLTPGSPVGLTVAAVDRVVRVLIEARQVQQNPSADQKWRHLRIRALEALTEAHPAIEYGAEQTAA